MISLVPPELAPGPRLMGVGEVFTDPARTIRITVVSRTQDRPAGRHDRAKSAAPSGQRAD